MTCPPGPLGGGCKLWPLVHECLPADWPADPEQWTPLQRASVEAASAILRRLTAGIFNYCPLTIRPCRRRCAPERFRYLGDSLAVSPWQPALVDGRIYNIACGVCRDECGCGPLQELVLDPFAHCIVQVKVDGVVLPPSAYRVDDWRRLVRVDGGRWPECQNLSRPDTDPGTWSVTYWTGTPPDAGASFALTDLAVEWWKACQDKKCSLGENVKQVARQGITYDIDTVYEAIREGRTGLKRVDLWIFSVNPHGLRRRFRVYSPDVPDPGRRATWPALPIPGGGGGPSEWCADCAAVWDFPTPQDVWTISHGLGYEPAGIQITGADGQEVRGEVTYPDPDTVRIGFSRPVAGRARLS